jgi:hypothetical protein
MLKLFCGCDKDFHFSEGMQDTRLHAANIASRQRRASLRGAGD